MICISISTVPCRNNDTRKIEYCLSCTILMFIAPVLVEKIKPIHLKRFPKSVKYIILLQLFIILLLFHTSGILLASIIFKWMGRKRMQRRQTANPNRHAYLFDAFSRSTFKIYWTHLWNLHFSNFEIQITYLLSNFLVNYIYFLCLI